MHCLHVLTMCRYSASNEPVCLFTNHHHLIVCPLQAKELMDALRAKHANPGLEHLVQELMSSRFVPRAEERLLLVLHVLLQRCYKNGLPDGAEVPAPLKRELANVCRACSAAEGAGRVGRMAASTVLFTERLINGLTPDSPEFPSTLGRLLCGVCWCHVVLV